MSLFDCVIVMIVLLCDITNIRFFVFILIL